MTIQAETKLQTYHAMMVVTRAEEWCVQATSPEEAKALLQAGQGHRCSAGEIFAVELDEFDLP
jgi:putative SOS response-associated peptidase YedK